MVLSPERLRFGVGVRGCAIPDEKNIAASHQGEAAKKFLRPVPLGHRACVLGRLGCGELGREGCGDFGEQRVLLDGVR